MRRAAPIDPVPVQQKLRWFDPIADAPEARAQTMYRARYLLLPPPPPVPVVVRGEECIGHYGWTDGRVRPERTEPSESATATISQARHIWGPVSLHHDFAASNIRFDLSASLMAILKLKFSLGFSSIE